ncbi:hypothetical protein SDC9_180854 [bioreactor metagenome]|uniref:Uncharacterized protein n=1 Tax=bioreactor metagenome TaxID=1076179 RepID=A0A645H2W3_9ZZZZ
MNGAGADGSTQVATVAAPVHKRLIDGNLAEQIVHIVIGTCALAEYHAFAGGGRCIAHAVNLFAIGVGAAQGAQKDGVANRTGLPGRFGQILKLEEHTFAGASAHIGGGNADLRSEGHGMANKQGIQGSSQGLGLESVKQA